jgi:hypothetical protein
MPYGGGTYTLVYNFTTEAATPPIEIAKLDAQFTDIGTALSNCLLRDGTGLPVADIPFNSQKLTGLGNATADSHALNRVTGDGRYPQLGAANTFTYTQEIASTGPALRFRETDAAANNRSWDVFVSGETFNLRVVNDALDSAVNFMTVNRTDNTVDSIALAATAITVNGVAVSDFARLSTANTFTGGHNVIEGPTQPEQGFNVTGGASNEKRWGLVADTAGRFIGFTRTDAEVYGATWLQVERTGTTVDSIDLIATAITLNGVAASDYARLSSTNTFTGANTFAGTGVELRFDETDAAADNGHWLFLTSAEGFHLRAYDDAWSTSNPVFIVNRTGTTVDSIALTATAVTVNGSAVQTASNLLATILTVDGAGSGLDADLLDGQSGAYYQSASNLNAGTLPDARFPATLPAVSGVNLTALNASNVASGDLAYARFSTALLANDGAGSGLDADLLDGQSGAYYQSASNLNAGTLPDARFPATLPAVSGVNLTALNATQLTSGTIPAARVTSVDAAATINSETIGYRGVPRSTTATTLAVGDNGKCVAVSTHIAVPNSTFAAGNCVTVYNNSAAAINITKSAGTQYKAGVNADDASISLASRGLATIWFNSATEWVVSGNVS